MAGADRRQRLFRIYRLRDPVSGQVRSPWFFAAVPPGTGRFDLPVPRGTCYWTDHGYAAWLEVFRGTGLVDRADVDARRMAVATPPPLRLADLRAPAARRYGVTAEVSTTDDYQLSQRWAAAIAAAGFTGLRAAVRHDPTLRAASVAVFGPAGARTRMAGWTHTRVRLDADAELLAELAAFGTGIAPRPFDIPVIAPARGE